MGCGYDLVVPCSAATYTVDAITVEALAAGEKATHSGTCEFCGGQFTLECEVDYVPSAKTSEESYWDYSKCVCGRENIEHIGTAIVRCGDANGDDAIDLLDAVKILRKSVRPEMEIKDRNADVDGDDIIQPKDALLAIRIWLGNNEAINVAKAAEERFNGNLYNPDAVVLNQRLDMSGEGYAAEGYLITDPIEIKEGEKISFGPARLSVPVMGYFYDAEGNALQLINYENVTEDYTFEAGQSMVSITAPEGAKTVQLQLTEQEKDQFYVRINAELTLMGYQKQVLANTEEIVNPLKNRKLLTVGDSLCAAANDTYNNGMKGWAARIRDTYGANVINCSQGGAALCDARLVESPSKPRQYILNQLLENTNLHKFDYILLEGGGNDASVNYESVQANDEVIKAPIGTYHPTSYDPADFDDQTTLAGGMERLIYNAIKEHGDTAAIGFFVPYSMPLSASFAGARDHFNAAIAICEKWGVKSLCLLDGFVFDTADLTSDGVHATAEGYDLMQPHINGLLEEMRPVPQEVYNAVFKKQEILPPVEGGGALYSAEENPYKDTLKILAIGNSFSADATKHLWGIANSYGVENVVIGNMSIGGCSLDTHYENIVNDAAAYDYVKWTSVDHVGTSNTAISTALKDEDWDIITIQQASGENLVFDNPDNKYDTTANPVDTYSKVDEILDYLNQNKPKESTKILWHMTWAYQADSTHKAFAAYGNDQMVMYNSLLDRAQELKGKYTDIAGVLPSGTAIQNLRGTSVGDTVTRDGYHMSYGLGRYTVALTWYCYITGANAYDVKYVPADYVTYIVPYQNEIAASVMEAIQDPYNKR